MGYDGMRGSGVRRARWPPPGGGGGARGAVADGSCRAMPGAGASRARACMIMHGIAWAPMGHHGPPTPIHPRPPKSPNVVPDGPRTPQNCAAHRGNSIPLGFVQIHFIVIGPVFGHSLRMNHFLHFLLPTRIFCGRRPPPPNVALPCGRLWAPGVPGPRVLGGGWGWMGAGAPQESDFSQFLLPDRPGGLTLKGILAPRGQTMPRPGNKRPVCFHLGQWSAPGGRKSN